MGRRRPRGCRAIDRPRGRAGRRGRSSRNRERAERRNRRSGGNSHASSRASPRACVPSERGGGCGATRAGRRVVGEYGERDVETLHLAETQRRPGAGTSRVGRRDGSSGDEGAGARAPCRGWCGDLSSRASLSQRSAHGLPAAGSIVVTPAGATRHFIDCIAACFAQVPARRRLSTPPALPCRRPVECRDRARHDFLRFLDG